MSNAHIFHRLPVEVIAMILDLASYEDDPVVSRPSPTALLNVFHLDSRLRTIASQQRSIYRNIAKTIVRWHPFKPYHHLESLLHFCHQGNPKALRRMTLCNGLCIRRLASLYQYINHFGGSIETLWLMRLSSFEDLIPICICELCSSIDRVHRTIDVAFQLIFDVAPTLKDLKLHFQALNDWASLNSLASWATVNTLARPEDLYIIMDWTSHSQVPLRTICCKLTKEVRRLKLETVVSVTARGLQGRVGFFTEIARSSASTVEDLTMILRSTEVDREPFSGTTFPQLKTLTIDVWDGVNLLEFPLEQRGIMPKLHSLEIPAAFLDAVHTPNVESVVIRIYRDTNLPSILRSLQEWKSLRCLRLHASSKALAPIIIKIIQALIESIGNSSSSTRLLSLKCLLLTFHHEGDPNDPGPLGFIESDHGLMKLARSSWDARRYRTIDGFHVVNQWGLANGMENSVGRLLLAHRASLRRAHTSEEEEEEEQETESRLSEVGEETVTVWTHRRVRCPPAVALNDEEEEEEGREEDQDNRRRSLSFRRAESDPGPITTSSCLEE